MLLSKHMGGAICTVTRISLAFRNLDQLMLCHCVVKSNVYVWVIWIRFASFNHLKMAIPQMQCSPYKDCVMRYVLLMLRMIQHRLKIV